MNSALPDNSFIDSSFIRLNTRDYSMRISPQKQKERHKDTKQIYKERLKPEEHLCFMASGSRGIFRFKSFARRLSQRNRGDRESVQVAPEQLDEARFAEFDLAAREDARPSERGRSGQFISGAGLHRRAIVRVLRVNLVSEAEMFAGFRRAVRLPVNKSQAVLGDVEMRVESDGFLQMFHGLLGAALLEVGASDQVMHLRRRVEFEGASQMRQRFIQFAFAREDPSESVMRGEGMIVQRQRALQVDLGRFHFALIAAQQPEQQPGAEMFALFVERAAQKDRSLERFAQVEIVLADGEGEFGVALVERERGFEHPQSAARSAFADEQDSFLDLIDEIFAARAAIRRNDLIAAFVEAFALGGLFVMTRDAAAPSLFELFGVNRAHLGEDLGQRFEHHVIIETACGLLLREFEQLLEAVVRAGQRRFQRADAFEQMFFDGVLADVERGRAVWPRNQHQNRATFLAVFRVGWIGFLTTLAKDHMTTNRFIFRGLSSRQPARRRCRRPDTGSRPRVRPRVRSFPEYTSPPRGRRKRGSGDRARPRRRSH